MRKHIKQVLMERDNLSETEVEKIMDEIYYRADKCSYNYNDIEEILMDYNLEMDYIEDIL